VPFSIRPEFSPGAPGGVCFICRAAKRAGDVVIDCLVDPDDLNWTVPTNIVGMAFELATGSLEICSTCWIEAASELGMASAEKAASLADKVETLERLLAVTAEQRDAAAEALKTLTHYNETKAIADKVFGPEPK
jgi:hypothetical protein